MQKPYNRLTWEDPSDVGKLGIIDTFSSLTKRDRRKLERYGILPCKIIRLLVENGLLEKTVESPVTGLTVEGLTTIWDADPRPKPYVQDGRHFFLQLFREFTLQTPRQLWKPRTRFWEWAERKGKLCTLEGH